MALTDRIYVMKDGEVVDHVVSAEAIAENIQRKMVGRDIDKEYYREDQQRPYQAEKLPVELDKISLPAKILRCIADSCMRAKS